MSKPEKFVQVLEQNGLNTLLLDLAEKSDFIASIVALQLQDTLDTVLRMISKEEKERPEVSPEDIVSGFRKDDLNIRIKYMLARYEQKRMKHRLALEEMMS